MIDRSTYRVAPLLAVGTVSMLACIAWSFFAGKDLSWDYGNYHLYLGRSVFLPRWGQDFLPASIQSYLNPFAYVPIAAMVHWGWRDVLIGSAMAALHSVNLLLIWLIAERLISGDLRHRQALRVAAVVLAALSPVFLQQVGGTFADITTAVPFLLGYYILLRAASTVRRRSLLAAGVSFGVAVGLKLTNAPLVIGAGLAIFTAFGGSWRERWQAVLIVGMGSMLGFATIHGYWGWRLYQEFGNPFYPFFNGIFRSPDYPAVSISHLRFLQDSLWSNLTYLFRMALPDRGVYIEKGAPDVRVAVAAVLLACLAGAQAWSRLRPAGKWPQLLVHERFVIVSFVLGGMAWLATTGNGRYATPLLLIVGPLIVWLWARLVPSPRWSVYGVLLILLVQASSVVLGADWRWNAHAWGGKWVNVQMPKKLAAEPFLFLSIDMFSQSYLVEHLHPKSGFSNVSGQYTLGPRAPGYARLERLLRAYEGRVRMLISPRMVDTEGRHMVELPEYEGAAARYGFEIDTADCEKIRVREAIDKLISPTEFGQPDTAYEAALAESGRGLGVSCGLRPLSAGKSRRYQEQLAAVDPIFDRLEVLCPNLFRPHGPVTEISGTQATRKYFDTDIWLWIQDGFATYHVASKGELFVNLGRVSDLMGPKAKIDCALRFGHHFSTEEFGKMKHLFK